MTAKRRLLNTANRVLRPAGVRLERLPVDGRADSFDAAERSKRAAQHGSERLITARHNDQGLDDVRRLNAKYAASVLGEIDTWELLMMLGACVDPTDSALGAVSQLAHVLQTLEMMIADGVTDEDLLLDGKRKVPSGALQQDLHLGASRRVWEISGGLNQRGANTTDAQHTVETLTSFLGILWHCQWELTRAWSIPHGRRLAGEKHIEFV